MKLFGYSYQSYVGKVLTIISPLLSDRTYLKLFYRLIFHKRLNLENPKTFNEKLQWLKLNDKHPEFTQLVDKYESRKFVADVIGEDYLIPLLGVWKSFDDINFDSLPEQFVLKTNHDSQGVVVCKDKSTFDIKAARKKLTQHLKRNYYWNSREYPYKDVPRRIVAEKYMEDKKYGELRDYKFFCFNGDMKFFYVASGRLANDLRFCFFDDKLNALPFTQVYHPLPDKLPELPSNIQEMMDIARKLCSNYPFVRIDLYNIDGKIYCGEFTFFHNGGLVPFVPSEYDAKLGEYIHLPIEG